MPVYAAPDVVKGYTTDAQGVKTPIPAEYMAQVAVTITNVRDNLRDWSALNEITRQELTDNEYADCILDAIAEFNARPPFAAAYDPVDFPDRKLLQDMATVEAMQRLYQWHARNQFSASDAGLQIPIHEQWQPLMAIARTDEQRNDQRMDRLKTQLNLRNGWGRGIGSPVGWGW